MVICINLLQLGLTLSKSSNQDLLVTSHGLVFLGPISIFSDLTYIYFLTRVMTQLIGTHQILPRSPWLSRILSSLGVASLASVRDWFDGNIFFRACKKRERISFPLRSFLGREYMIA